MRRRRTERECKRIEHIGASSLVLQACSRPARGIMYVCLSPPVPLAWPRPTCPSAEGAALFLLVFFLHVPSGTATHLCLLYLPISSSSFVNSPNHHPLPPSQPLPTHAHRWLRFQGLLHVLRPRQGPQRLRAPRAHRQGVARWNCAGHAFGSWRPPFRSAPSCGVGGGDPGADTVYLGVCRPLHP